MENTLLPVIGYLIYLPLITDAYCDWPSYLHPGSSWRYRFRHGGADLRGNPAAIVEIQERAINFNYQNIGEDTPNSFQWRCESPVESVTNLYLVSKSYFSTPDNAREPLEFMCVRITPRGRHVLQLEMTSSWFDNPDADVCVGQRLRPHQWLLLGVGEPEAEECPLVGGYDLRLFDSSSKEYCSGVYNPARLESQCDLEESMVLNFQDCPHNLLVENMQRYQDLECLTHWVQQGFIFVVLFSLHNQGFWTLRLPHRFQQADVFNSVLLSDVIYDPSDMIDPRFSYVNLQMKRVIYDDLCADASSSCIEDDVDIVCAPDNMFGHIFCKRTCNKCPVHFADQPCEFHAGIMTVWRPLFMRSNETNADRSRSTLFSIAEEYIEYGHRGQLTCIQQEQDLGYMRYALADVKHNGCAPRFHCLMINRLTPIVENAGSDYHRARHGHQAGRVVAYKTEQGAIWPDFEEAFYCNARMTGSGFQESFWDFAVSGSRRLNPSRCDLKYIAYNFKQTFSSDETCEGTLTKQYCSHDSTLFTISPKKCSNSFHERPTTYSCLLSFEQTQSETNLSAQIIIIQARGLPNYDYMCLVIQQGPQPALLLHRRACLEFYFYGIENSHAHLQLFEDDELCIAGEQNIVGHSGATHCSSLLWCYIMVCCLLANV